MKKQTVTTRTLKPENWHYKVDGVEHIYCGDCVPDIEWILNMVKAKRLEFTHRHCNEPCEACGHIPS